MYGIKGQLLKAFLVVIAVLWLSTTLVLFLNFQITQQYKLASDVMVSKYLLLDSGADLNEAFNTIMLSSDANVREADQRLLDAKNNIAEQKQFLEQNLTDIQSKANYLGFAASLDEFTDLVDDGVSRFRVGNLGSYFADYDAATKQFQFVQENGITLLLGELEYFSTIRDDLSKSYRESLINGVILIILLVVGCILFVFNFSKVCASPSQPNHCHQKARCRRQ